MMGLLGGGSGNRLRLIVFDIDLLEIGEYMSIFTYIHR